MTERSAASGCETRRLRANERFVRRRGGVAVARRRHAVDAERLLQILLHRLELGQLVGDGGRFRRRQAGEATPDLVRNHADQAHLMTRVVQDARGHLADGRHALLARQLLHQLGGTAHALELPPDDDVDEDRPRQRGRPLAEVTAEVERVRGQLHGQADDEPGGVDTDGVAEARRGHAGASREQRRAELLGQHEGDERAAQDGDEAGKAAVAADGHRVADAERAIGEIADEHAGERRAADDAHRGRAGRAAGCLWIATVRERAQDHAAQRRHDDDASGERPDHEKERERAEGEWILQRPARRGLEDQRADDDEEHQADEHRARRMSVEPPAGGERRHHQSISTSLMSVEPGADLVGRRRNPAVHEGRVDDGLGFVAGKGELVAVGVHGHDGDDRVAAAV